jgi:hypothetical protein
MSAADPDDDTNCPRHGSLISTRPLPLRRTGGTTWNPLRWLWLAWRYGWSHPDEDLLGVIDAAGDALRAQLASARAVLNGEALQEAIRIEAELERELCQDVPGLAAVLGLEARINALYPPAIQRRRAWMLRERFERVAPARAVLEYWGSNPPEAGGPEVLAEEVRRCEGIVERTNAALAAANAGKDQGAIQEAQTKTGRATAERDVARAHVETDRSRRAMAAAIEAARTAATGAQDVRDAAQAVLEAARRTHGAALDRLDAAEELLVERGGAIPAMAGTAIDADAQTLIGYIHSSYMMSIGREKAVRDLMRWLIMRFWSANVISVLVLLIVFILFKALPGTDFMPLANLVVGLFFIAAVGRIGGTMSVLQRLQSAVSANILSGDSFLELVKLRTGKNGINLGLFSGSVFALLLYAIFATGAPAMLGFENGIFPQMATRTVAAGTSAPANQSQANVSAGATTSGTTQKREATGEAGGNASEAASSVAAGEGNSIAASEGNSIAAGEGNSVAAGEGNSIAAGEGNSVAADANATGSKVPTPVLSFGQRLSAFFGNMFDTSSASVQCKANQPCDPFTQLADALGFPTRMDFFKLLLWAFLAGFAERLVPDVLDSITRRTRSNFNAEEEAAERRRRAAAGGATPADHGATPADPEGDGGRARTEPEPSG